MNERTLSAGSVWYRWDPHLHTPETLLNDQFGGWDGYLAALEADNRVRALGVTDYCSIETYKKIVKYRSSGRLGNFEFLFPNIEFRTSPETSDGKAINVHILVDPSDSEHIDNIERALRLLVFRYDGNPYSCDIDGLTRLGRAHSPDIMNTRSALEHGALQFKPSFEAFREWYSEQGWLKANSLIAMSNGKDGTGGLSRDAGFSASRDELHRFSHIVFSPNPKDRVYFLGKGGDSEEIVIRQKGSLKPCLHGSDAHTERRLFEPNEKRYCWIKADLTFEGLRQVLFEPEDRVYIGEHVPTRHLDGQVIEAVEIADVGALGWFNSVRIPLNQGLVAIIGARGSGKSALAELIAHAAGGWRADDGASFIERAGNGLAGQTVQLRWRDGDETASTLLARGVPTDARVRYLSQRFVERLCSEDYDGGDLVKEIERVIFAHTKKEDRLDAKNFTELRERRTALIRETRAQRREQIKSLIDEFLDLRKRQHELPSKRLEREALERNISAIQAQISNIATGDEKQFSDNLATCESLIAEIRKKIAFVRGKIGTLDAVEHTITLWRERISEFEIEVRKNLSEIGVNKEEDIQEFIPKFGARVEDIIKVNRDILTEVESKIIGSGPSDVGSLSEAMSKLEETKSFISSNNALRQTIADLQSQLSKIHEELVPLSDYISKVENDERKRFDSIVPQIIEKYVNIVELLKEEEEVLTKMYAPLLMHLQNDETGPRPIEFSIRWFTRMDDWAARYEGFLDRRKVSVTPVTVETLVNDFAKTKLSGAWKKKDPIDIASAINEIVDAFDIAKREASEYIKPSAKESSLLHWMFDDDYVRLNYGLRYNGVDLEKLSPGMKGIVLLILYLIMDNEDRRPLIIDQPEENLDNESIYKLLVPHFRRAKMDRQIIIVTHNPNLVINTDAEQVVIATCNKISDHPKISYTAGSLEDPDTRERICAILEGGRSAFQRRERRYGQPLR